VDIHPSGWGPLPRWHPPRRRVRRSELRSRTRDPGACIPGPIRRSVRDRERPGGRPAHRALRPPGALWSVPRAPRRATGRDRPRRCGDRTLRGRSHRARARWDAHAPPERLVLAPRRRRQGASVSRWARPPAGARCGVATGGASRGSRRGSARSSHRAGVQRAERPEPRGESKEGRGPWRPSIGPRCGAPWRWP